MKLEATWANSSQGYGGQTPHVAMPPEQIRLNPNSGQTSIAQSLYQILYETFSKIRNTFR